MYHKVVKKQEGDTKDTGMKDRESAERITMNKVLGRVITFAAWVLGLACAAILAVFLYYAVYVRAAGEPAADIVPAESMEETGR